jgi:outer membrane protein TolC
MPSFAQRRLLPLLAACTFALGGCHSIALPPHGPSVTPTARFGAPIGGILQASATDEAEPAGDATEPAHLGSPVIPAPVREEEIDLCAALERAGIANPTIGLAEEAVRASEALRLQACALLLPTLNAGTNVRVHQGTLIGAAGTIRQVNIQSLYYGFGANVKAAETVAIPGIRIYTHLADACYAPQAAQQHVIARRFDALAVRNHTLLEVGTSYLVLVGAHGELQALRRSQEDVHKIVQLTANFAKAGQGRDSDAQRARAQWLLIETQAEQTQEQVAVAAAELARLLDLDPSMRLVPADAVPPLVELVDPATPLPQLLQMALANHPEVGARNADIATTEIRVRQEHMRPWLPLVMAGFSYGNFGGTGSQSDVPGWSSGARIDCDVAAVWSLQNLFVGNRAVQNRTRAEAGQAAAARIRVVNRIRDEVGEAHALILARRQQIEIARRRIETGQKAFDEDILRSRNLEGRPIEVLRSAELLTTGRLDLVRAMVGYSEAQLQLYVALGNAPTCPR